MDVFNQFESDSIKISYSYISFLISLEYWCIKKKEYLFNKVKILGFNLP
jgi:hypothetical protein